MKRRFTIAAATLAAFAAGIVSLNGQGNVLREARVTQIVKDVKILPAQGEARPATTTDTIRGNTGVRTGAESRAELTFSDLTIARLGANTIFSFNEGTRTVDLADGAILLRVPKGSGGAKIQTAAVTAAITGTTVIAEYHPKSHAKYLVLEGVMRIYFKGVLGESLLLHAGQMIILNPNARRLPEVVDFDLERLMRTSLFIQGFAPIPSSPLIAADQQKQLESKAAGELIDTNLVIFGRGTLVTLTDPQSSDVIDRKTAAVTLPIPVPVPTPNKIGRPPLIANSAAFRIAGASAIQTDPSIRNPGRTDFGKIYRGPGADANFSLWSFDTTRPFDTSSGFDAFYSNAGVPIAAFKFQSLVLAGNPAISTANGGATFLELIGVGGITSAAPGGVLTFPGIDNLLVAAQNGSILLGPEISFQNIPALFFYARGAGSNIVLGSPIAGTRDLFLEAEGSVQVNGAETVTNFRSVTGGDFLAGTGPVNASTIDIRSGGNLNFTLSQFAVGGRTGGTVTLNATGAVSIDARGDQTVFNNASSVLVNGQAINLLGNNSAPINLALARAATFTAGSGGFQGATVAFDGNSLLTITSGANIDVFRVSNAASITAATSISAVGDLTALSRIVAGTTINAGGRLGTNFSNITAGQSITSGADLNGGAVQAGTFIDAGGNLATADVNAGTNIRVTANMTFIGGATAGGSITVGGNVGTTAVGVLTAGTTINVGGNLNAPKTTAGQSITVGGNFTATNSATAGTTINVGGTFRAPVATAGGDISANRITLFNVTTPGVLRAGGGGITPFIATPAANLLHTFTVSSIVAAGGINFSGDNFVAAGAGTEGGKLLILGNTITFDGANITSANFDGASGVPTNSAGGSGGQLMLTITGAITVNAPIETTTGLNAVGVPFGGTGGNALLTSTGGPVNVNSGILVSSNDPAGPAPGPLRRSSAGGILSLTSGLTTGNAITLGGNAQLLSLLNAGAPGPAGQITISSAGGNIVDNGANIRADRGTITIQQTAAAPVGTGQITLDGGTITSETLLASSRGDLTIGGATPVNLAAITLSLLATNNVTWSGGTLNAAPLNSSGNVTVQSGNDILLTGPLTVSRLGGGATNGLNLTINAGRNFQSASSVNLTADGSLLTTGANILFQSGGTMIIGAPAPATATFVTGPVTDNQANGSNITINAGGAVSSKGLFASVAIGAGRTLTNGGNIAFTGAGSYNATGPDAGMDFQIVNSSPAIITTGGNISLRLNGTFTGTGDVRLNLAIDNRGGRIQTGANIDATVGTGLTANLLNLQIDNRGGGFIGNGAGISYIGGGTTNVASSASFTILNSATAGTIGSDAFIKIILGDTNIGTNLLAFIENTDGKIGGAGGSVTLQINGKLAVTNRIDVFGTLTSTGTITAGEFSVTTANAPGISVGNGGITRFTFPSEPTAVLFQPYTITTNALTSTGGINFNGPDLTGGRGPFDGGQLTINVPSLTFGPGGNIQGPVTFNGGGTTTNLAAGSGGVFNVNATGAISVGSPIQATTGLRADGAIPSGNGGTVNLVSAAGTVGVSAPITVSSADPSTGANRRRSNAGGNINLQSNVGTAVAINITNTGQLLSLLDAAATGPGGKITILATAADSAINVTGDPSPVGAGTLGTIRADKGSVDIRHTGAAGTISLSNAQISADIIKVGALGNAGTLTIGGGRISADTILKLYAPGTNGSITFIADVTLSAGTTNIIAANTITINDRVLVNIGGNPAQIFTNRANYSGFGGNGTTTGTFTGAGAQNPQPLANAPAFGPPGGP